ncbi:molybdenum cofactor biosynthesis protein MoaE [Winogradskyella bathintestinalis]|uniref:Molybdopterin synthase catalytic subunit n=1 Tax=Winogradskyella bathintestinalis TaxID=3035208 RepID=A0ABT7ZSA2_9FLAO|nr:molybdenum cofactor biosynthesis protein MoaE [Winogradskyella bathintestinalis]MDN3491896.1 molybdenum cofactor biosynthesis protein MoaE [Winogradskyella bathintestinalis]
MKKVFIKGPITPQFISDAIEKHQTKHSIGAHNIFLGQVRADEIKNKTVAAIDFTCYEGMANPILEEIREKAFEKFNLTCMHIYHSLGTIKAGEICFFVFVSAKHSKDVYDATEFLVNTVKKKVPIFGKEIFEDESHQWKVNQ